MQVTNLDNLSRQYAVELDQEDELARYKTEFYQAEGTIYLDGNSLGLMSKRAEQTLLDVMADWRQFGIDGWMKGKRPWYEMAETLGAKVAPLIGALPDEVIVTGSTTINIHQLVATFYRPEGKRTKILADTLTFPSDIYALQSQLRIHGFDPDEHLLQVLSRDGKMIEEEDIIEMMTDEVALILLPTVLYRSGQLLDIQRLTSEAKKNGIVIGFDACHSIGAIPHAFNGWDVDFAVWCHYKYVNSGPGGVAGLYVHEKHLGATPALAGWFSSDKEKQFDMKHQLEPAQTAGAFQIGTPHVLSMAPLYGSLEIFEEAGIEQIREKSLHMTRYMMDLIQAEMGNTGFSFMNPTEDHRRGGHIALVHEEAIRICKALKEEGIIPDYREPNIIRLAPIALYTSYLEVWQTVQVLKRIMVEKRYEKYEKKREVVA
ncbi:kynureninase [Mechercharimyces sp. CAU 1602]|nr:kynureninase [Mechercharimyces sp. CAU 1602]MCS1351639.1 kynureninase [Mechercharimyces sp. CAU 1602]